VEARQPNAEPPTAAAHHRGMALDAAYDSDTTRATLADRDLQGQIARKGTPGPDPGH
jgi:hypothetical protein